MQYPLRTLLLGVVVMTAALALAGCSSSTAEPTTAPVAPAATADEPGPNQIIVDNFAFRPARLEVAAGTKVTWINRDDVPHTATSTAKPRAFDSRTLDTDDQFAHVFTTPGTYAYFCAVHPHMTGTIVVK